jgi:hypothetical protein
MSETVQKPKTDTILKCGRCGKTEQVNFQESMTLGWKECCGEPMRLTKTTADIRKAIKGALEAQVCILCRQPASHKVSYTVPDGKETTISVLACYRHSYDLRDVLKWYLVTQSLWYPDCIKIVDIVSSIELS